MVMAEAVLASSQDGEEWSESYTPLVIIGGGIAGLAAAAHVAKRTTTHRVPFRLLEARQRLGGRVMTIPMASGCNAEMGASWIHGVMGNPLYELAAANRLLNASDKANLNAKAPKVAAVTEDGRRVPFHVLQEVYEAYFWFFRRCEEYFVRKYKAPPNVKSVGDHIELEISMFLQKFAPPQRRVRRLIFDYLLKRECCITGCDTMQDVDLLALGSYTELPGGNLQLPRGYSSLLGPVIKAIPKESIVRKCAVKHIHWRYRLDIERANDADKEEENDSDTGSDHSAKTVKSQPNSGSRSRLSSVSSSIQSSVCATPLEQRSCPNVKIECENGNVYYTDFVICTIPLGVLKEKQHSLFQPQLPKDKCDAMDRLHFGTVDKIFLEYDRPFLSPDIDEVIMLWEPSSTTPITTKDDSWLADNWYRNIYSFTKMNPTLLMAWIHGPEARYMEKLKMNEVADTCTKLLRTFLSDPNVPSPKSCVFTAWHSQTRSRGSYTTIGVGGSHRDIERMASPLFLKPINRSPVLLLAGEHCHPTFYSTGHGAYLSGRSAAHYFLDAVSKSNEERHNEQVIRLDNASVKDISTWLKELKVDEQGIKRDDGKLVTPR